MTIGSASLWNRIQHDGVIALERDLVRVPSYRTEEAPLSRVIFDHMQRIGLRARLDPVALGDGQESFNVAGEIPGPSTSSSLLLIGDTDHVPALGRALDVLSLWSRRPFEGVVEGDWFYGKGAQDEKGGLCAMLMAAKALIEEGSSRPLPCSSGKILAPHDQRSSDLPGEGPPAIGSRQGAASGVSELVFGQAWTSPQ